MIEQYAVALEGPAAHASGLRRLIFHVPFHVFVARTEITFLGARGFFIASHADNHTGEIVFIQHGLEAVLFQGAAAFDACGFAVRKGDAGKSWLL